MGNPFLDDFPELVTLDSRNCMDESVVNSLCSLEDTGEKQYQEFVKTVFEDFTRSIHDPIKRNSLAKSNLSPESQLDWAKKLQVFKTMLLFLANCISLCRIVTVI